MKNDNREEKRGSDQEGTTTKQKTMITINGAPDKLLGDLAGNSFSGSVILAVLIGKLAEIDLPFPSDMDDAPDSDSDKGEDLNEFIGSFLSCI